MKNTNHHYVLVLTSEGPIFVTGIGEGKTAFWDKAEAPKEFNSSYAENLAFGLMVNGYMAYHIVSRIEFDTQPYRYNSGHFKWVWNNKEEGK